MTALPGHFQVLESPALVFNDSYLLDFLELRAHPVEWDFEDAISRARLQLLKNASRRCLEVPAEGVESSGEGIYRAKRLFCGRDFILKVLIHEKTQ